MNLAALAEGHPDGAPALVHAGETITYGELRARVARVRGGLGAAPGDRVAIVCGNVPEFVVGYLAVVGAGGIAVPLNPASPAPELEHHLGVVGASRVLRPADVAALASASSPAPIAERQPSDVAVLAFTAGTAGAARAAMLTHGNLDANLRQAQAMPGRGITETDVSLAVVPLFHIFGLNVVLGLSLRAGASVVLVERFDPLDTLDVIGSTGCTIVAGAPPMWSAWARLPDLDPEAFRTVRLGLSGAAPLPAGVRSVLSERFGLRLEEGYGLTEAAPSVTAFGRPLPGVAIRLVGDDGDDVPLGDPGEVWVKGPNVFAGYWNDPEATRAVLTPDGWLRTGDVGVASEDGSLRLIDRIKDIVIVSGFNVYPAEVETVLCSHPAVQEASVVGVPDRDHGEAIKAFVVATSAVEPAELVAWCADHLAHYKCPREIVLTDSLPTAPAGKVLRRELRGAAEA